jgi:hypothetical protein
MVFGRDRNASLHALAQSFFFRMAASRPMRSRLSAQADAGSPARSAAEGELVLFHTCTQCARVLHPWLDPYAAVSMYAIHMQMCRTLCVNQCVGTNMQAGTYTYTRYMHTLVHTHIHRYLHACTHTYTHTCKRTSMPSCMRIYEHTYLPAPPLSLAPPHRRSEARS